MDSSQVSLLTFEGVNGGPGEEGRVIVPSAEALCLRLSEQEHWEQAESVHDGRQPRCDPDHADLEELGDGIRTYRLHEVDGTMDDLPARISQRLVKRLEAGVWETEFVVDSYQRGSSPPIAL